MTDNAASTGSQAVSSPDPTPTVPPAPAPRLRIVELAAAPVPFLDLTEVRREWEATPSTSAWRIPETSPTWLDCRRSIRGPWAGPLSWLTGRLPEIEQHAPELLETHRVELGAISPSLRSQLPDRDLPLTEAGPVKERVRSYPVDRAFRLAHGLVDLVLTLQRRPGAKAADWICFGFDDAGAMTQRFLVELYRRAARTVDGAPIHMTLVVSPGAGDATAALFDGTVGAQTAASDLSLARPEPLELASVRTQPSREELRLEADRLEALLDDDVLEVEQEGSRLISLFEHLGQPDRAVRWRVLLLAIFNHFGWYEDALHAAQPLVETLDEVADTVKFSRWHIVSGLFNALAALGRAEEAHVLVRDEALAKVDDTTDLVSIYYTMAMLHVRFLPERNLELGEEYLERSLEMVERADLDEAERHYLKVFNLNGLAFIRHLQGEPPKAIELCESGYEQLEEHLGADEYRLHRSVLLYNLAQVYASTGAIDTAYEHYTGAIAIDPNYSEYFNERAGVLLRMGRLDEALADLEHAIELSPPYPEVWVNLGQTQNLRGCSIEAIAAYDRALELDPGQVLPRVGRAQAREATGDPEGAAEDYRAALDLDPEQPLVWANLAAIEHEQSRFDAALVAIDEAIQRQPDAVDLHAGRATVLEDLGRPEEAARSLRHCLTLDPDEEAAAELAARLVALGPAAAAPSAPASSVGSAARSGAQASGRT